MKKSLALKENAYGLTELEISLDYRLGGMNYFTNRNEPRGYYLSVTPLARKTHNGYETVMFDSRLSGYKHIVKEVTRKSNKAEQEALNESKAWEDEMVEAVLTQYGLELA